MKQFSAATLLFYSCLLSIQIAQGICSCVPGVSASICNYTNAAWIATNDLLVGLQFHTATLLPNGKVVLAGGSSTMSSQVYDPSVGQWTSTGNLNTPRYYHTASPLTDGTVLVFGGQSWIANAVSTSERYNPSTGLWTYTGNLSQPADLQTGNLLPNGMVVAIGGTNQYAVLSSIQLYNPASGQWSNHGNLTVARYSHTATLLENGLIIVVGGSGSSFIDTVELYDPNTALIVNTTVVVNTFRNSHTATALLSGQVLVTGGIHSSLVASTILYNPNTTTWSTTGSLNTERYYHTANLLPNGFVLVAGGIALSSSLYLKSAELYNPSTGIWTITDSLSSARAGQTGTLLQNGLVLVAGGGAGPSSTTSAEILTPSIVVTSNNGTLDGSLGGTALLQGPISSIPTPDCLFSKEGTTNRGYSILYTNTTTSISMCCSRIGSYSTASCSMTTCSGPTTLTNYFHTTDFCFSNCVDDSTTTQIPLFTVPAVPTNMSNTFPISSSRTVFILASPDITLPAYLVESYNNTQFGCRAQGNIVSTNGKEGCQYTSNICTNAQVIDYYTYLQAQSTSNCFALCYQ